MQKIVLLDQNGLKAISLRDLPDEAWHRVVGGMGGGDVQQYHQSVAWLYRAVALRAQAVSSLPFALVDGAGDEVDSSAMWQNTIGFLPNPQQLLYLIESALAMLGQAYLFQERNAVALLNLRYLLPTSVSPQFDELSGLTGFTRRLGHTELALDTEDVVYFWLPDPFVEVGPPVASPASAALRAAGVLFNVDEFAAEFFKRGAIRATLLTVDGYPPDAEKKRLKRWWQRAFSGIAQAWTTEVVSAAVKPVVVGEGVSELSDSELTQEKREDISTALGIPHTLLFSQAANYATAQVDRLSFYQDTIVPEARFIAEVLNEQVFAPLGLRWEFRPQTLDVFQQDEERRSGAYRNYIQAGMRPSVAAQILGIELPAGMAYEDLESESLGRSGGSTEERRAQSRREVVEELQRWRKKASRRGASAPFRSSIIPASVSIAVREAISLVGVEAAFRFLKSPDTSRESVEQNIAEKLLRIFQNQKEQVTDAIINGQDPNLSESEFEAELQQALSPELTEVAVEQSLRTALEVGIDFDIALVNADALAWAREYTYDLVKQLTGSTRKVIQQAIAAYVGTPGMEREDLLRLLEPAFGDVRARMIATTETTRAYSRAITLYRQLLKGAGIQMRMQWQTRADERVCPICGPLDKQPEETWKDSFPDGPPAHVNCRCWMVLQYVSNS